MKKAVFLVLPIILAIMIQIVEIPIYAASKYQIQYEKLAGTEDAELFNSYRDELLSYFNEIIKKGREFAPVQDRYITPLKKSDLDFNNEEKVNGYKIWEDYTDYSLAPKYDDVMEKLSEQGYRWYVYIKTEKTVVYANICRADKAIDDKGFYFGENNEWCVVSCNVECTTNKDGSVRTRPNLFNLEISADDNLKRFIKADKSNDIKVVYATIGDSETEFHYYMGCGIVFVNGRAEYLYSYGFNLRSSYLIEDTPESIENLLKSCSSAMYFNRIDQDKNVDRIKNLFDYDMIMSIINIYEEYALYES